MCRMKLVHSVWLKALASVPSAVQSASTVRRALARRRAFELGDCDLGGVQIRAVGRQVEEVAARGLDGFPHAHALVRAEIVHDDRVARL